MRSRTSTGFFEKSAVEPLHARKPPRGTCPPVLPRALSPFERTAGPGAFSEGRLVPRPRGAGLPVHPYRTEGGPPTRIPGAARSPFAVLSLAVLRAGKDSLFAEVP
jgi:hypothetical protein